MAAKSNGTVPLEVFIRTCIQGGRTGRYPPIGTIALLLHNSTLKAEGTTYSLWQGAALFVFGKNKKKVIQNQFVVLRKIAELEPAPEDPLFIKLIGMSYHC